VQKRAVSHIPHIRLTDHREYPTFAGSFPTFMTLDTVNKV